MTKNDAAVRRRGGGSAVAVPPGASAASPSPAAAAASAKGGAPVLAESASPSFFAGLFGANVAYLAIALVGIASFATRFARLESPAGAYPDRRSTNRWLP